MRTVADCPITGVGIWRIGRAHVDGDIDGAAVADVIGQIVHVSAGLQFGAGIEVHVEIGGTPGISAVVLERPALVKLLTGRKLGVIRGAFADYVTFQVGASRRRGVRGGRLRRA